MAIVKIEYLRNSTDKTNWLIRIDKILRGLLEGGCRAQDTQHRHSEILWEQIISVKLSDKRD